MAQLPSRSIMERAYLHSDASYDGVFFLGVRTTGVFCRPSCGARKPIPKNVDFFPTAREAVFAGYRPCKRCAPLSAVGALPGWVTQILQTVDRDPGHRITDARIRKMGIDPARARRFFQRNYGMTFQAYCRGRRLGKALEQIRQGSPIDDVALGFGYESHSGFREAFGKAFGTPPGKATVTEPIAVTWIESPLGPLIAAATAGHLVLLEFTDRRMLDAQFAMLRRLYKRPIVPGANPVLERLRQQLAGYFEGKLKTFNLPIDFPGTPFQRKVWEELLKIPYGKTISYEDLAVRVGIRHAQRAVGHANGLNRIAIVVPCHRVVNKNGKLGGYGGGLLRKQALLEIERGERLTGGE
jgi:AraC family transcriptional regulator, regulatory protein of adaptative response / methylated-DNA-[protein]-cysteine methyltransferase